ncbi:FecR domain-containing protein [Rhodopirellula bahusiensis]|uniref:Iron dicitrate transport regulator FecR n=1 Tax=Rhodopirellula bahusiensis TaxID=2014065 RepID=A0A2G1W4T6_9BACT|nr:FecR domain-containing protein [Rhodopirellula bahusiensis]PHQ34057.1 iron dicitrate transport regulator FecR [Rhodopirellula bahusiensis]
MDQQSFDELVAAYLDGSLDEQGIETLLRAVESSADLRRQFQEETRLNVLLRESMSEQVEINLMQQNATPAMPKRTAPPPLRSFAWLLLANAAALLIVCGIYFYRNATPETSPPFGICLTVSGSGEAQVERSAGVFPLAPETHVRVGDKVVCGEHARAVLRLVDGSILSLDKGTRVTLASARPEVNLDQGDVLFEVSDRRPDELPFQVHTSLSTIDVMGTIFGLADDGQTKLEVYEGRVSMIRHSDRKRIEVGSQQTVSTKDASFAVQDIAISAQQNTRLVPTDDMTLGRGKLAANSRQLKVEGGKRVIYLRFVVPELGALQTAKLQLTQEIDTGSGKLQVHLGEHSDWDEASLTHDNAPESIQLVDEHSGVVTDGQVVEMDVSKVVTQPGPLTLILTLDKDKENDIWFGSRKGNHPPQLILSTAVI